MKESPRKNPTMSGKSNKSIAKKGPYNRKSIKNTTNNNSNRRFSILSNSSISTDNSDSDDSDSSSNDHYLANKRLNTNNNYYEDEEEGDEDEEEDYSSSSDDENIDFVQLTKQRRVKAMKAVKSLKQQINENSSISPDRSSQLFEQEEPELDDDLVDAVIENEERNMNFDEINSTNTNTPNATNNNLNNSNNLHDYSDADLNDDLENMDFDFSFDDDDDNDSDKKKKNKDDKHKNNNNSNNNNNTNNNKTDSKNVLDKLRDEDIGELVQTSNPIINKTKSSELMNKKIDIDVPKLDEKEINSDADYEFDNNDLIQTLMKDNDDLELHNLDNSDDDFDYLIANQHNINHDIISKSNNKEILMDGLDNDDSEYLMKEETQAILDDFERDPKLQDSFKNRRSSMYIQQSFNNSSIDNNNNEDLDDLDLDLLNNFEQFLPKQQSMRRRSSILNQTLLSSSDDEFDMNMNMNINHNRPRKSYKKSSTKASKYASGNHHAKNIKHMLGITNSDSNFTSKFSSNAIVDSDDDTKLLEYIFEDSESENGPTPSQQIDGDETDEDVNLPKKSNKNIGSKHAKEILSSSKDQFRAPKLGTFITKKPYSIIDGVTTRFLHPLNNVKSSMLQRAASITNPNHPSISNNTNSNNNSNSNYNIALDELLNISEFDEDTSADQMEAMNGFFTDKRFPLTAFRNKGLNPNTMNSSELIVNSRRFSFTDKNNKKKNYKSSKSKIRSNKSLLKSKNHHLQQSQSQTLQQLQQSQQSPQQSQSLTNLLIPKSPDSNNINENDSMIFDPNNIDEVLFIEVESLNDANFINSNNNFEITAPQNFTADRKRKSISRASKARFRRASIAEAHAEGLRQTKNGLFDENVIDDVEALLIDMGDADDFKLLFGNPV